MTNLHPDFDKDYDPEKQSVVKSVAAVVIVQLTVIVTGFVLPCAGVYGMWLLFDKVAQQLG